jgi:hypothetical protein
MPAPLPADDADFFAARGKARSAGLHPAFYARLRSAIEDAEAATGEKVKINSLSRTFDEQAAAYRRYRTGQGGLAAPPGSSQHEIGAAADLAEGKALDWLHQNAPNYGLSFLKGKAGRMDRVHIQMAPEAPPASDPLAAINQAIGAPPRISGAMAFGDEPGGLFRGAGFNVPAAPATAPGGAPAPTVTAPSAAAPVAKPGSLFESAGFQLPDSPPAAAAPAPLPPGAAGSVEMPGGGIHYIDKSGNFLPVAAPAAPDVFRSAAEATSLSRIIGQAAPVVGHDIAEAARSSAGLVGQGLQNLVGNRPATGLGQTVLGGLGYLASPITGAAHSLGGLVTNLTGSPGTGERVEFMAGLGIPGAKGTQAGGALAKTALPGNKAINTLVDAVGPENAAEAARRLQANPRLTWADVSDPVRVRTQGLIDPAQPKAMNTITEAVKQRAAENPAAVNYAYTQAMGPAPDVMKMVEGLKERSRKAGSEQIAPAIANAKPVDTSPVIKSIDEIVKPGITAMLDPGTRLPLSPLQQELLRLRQQLVAPTGETLTDAARLHDLQSRVGDYAFQLMGGSPKDRQLGHGLRDINEKLIDRIDEAAGGAYRPARAKFKDAKDIHESFDEGFDVLKNRSGVNGLQDRPEALADWMKSATPEQIVAKRLGVRSDIDQKIKGVKNQVLAGTNITKIEYNRDKLETLFGKQEAGRLVSVMEDAADIAKTNAKLTEGSKTAETLAGRKAMEVRPVGGGNPLSYVTPVAAELLGQGAGLPGVGFFGVGALKAAHLGWQKVGQMSDLARNAAFARAALATGPERQATINRVLSHPKVVRQLQKSGNALTAPP